jgi:hypothetical protein
VACLHGLVVWFVGGDETKRPVSSFESLTSHQRIRKAGQAKYHKLPLTGSRVN